jgi:hypothetical protein
MTDEYARVWYFDQENWVRQKGLAVKVSIGINGTAYSIDDYGQVDERVPYDRIYMTNATASDETYRHNGHAHSPSWAIKRIAQDAAAETSFVKVNAAATGVWWKADLIPMSAS